ncbi:MAG TPA: hypothetical protein VGL03_14470 [Thermoanaerobaculia bacterium]|jgi:hypothetical protein
MKDRGERISALRRRAAWEREDLAAALRDIRDETSFLRHRWRIAGWAASGVAAAAAAGWKLFGRNSLAARVSRIASAASLLLGIGRGVQKIRRFW